MFGVQLFPLIAIPPVNCWLTCTALWGWGWEGRVLIQSRTWGCSGSGPGNVEVVDIAWAKRVGDSFSPLSPLLVAPVASLVQSQAFFFCEHLITVQQQVEKGGQQPDLFFSPIFSKFCCAKCLKFYKYESIEISLIKSFFV